MVLFFLLLLLVVLEGTFSGSPVYGRMKVNFSIAGPVMLSFPSRVTYDNDIHQKKKNEQFLIFIYQFQELITIFED